jgi:hypothetical protein
MNDDARNHEREDSIIPSCLTGLLSQCVCQSVCPSKLLYETVTIASPTKRKITNFKQIYLIYQMYNFNTP